MSAAVANFHDPVLGTLRCDDTLWYGTIGRGERDLTFCIAGTKGQPNVTLIERFAAILPQLESLEAAAKERLYMPCASAKLTDFKLECVSFLWPSLPYRFQFEFSLEGDGGAIWRVEFDGEQPTHTGRDD